MFGHGDLHRTDRMRSLILRCWAERNGCSWYLLDQTRTRFHRPESYADCRSVEVADRPLSAIPGRLRLGRHPWRPSRISNRDLGEHVEVPVPLRRSEAATVSDNRP